MSVLRHQIFDLAVGYGFPENGIRVKADSYRCPSPQWLIEQFGPEFNTFLQSNGIAFREGSFVCRDYACFAVMLAKMVWFKTAPSGDSLAVGMVSLPNLDHEINATVHRNPDESLRFEWHEPQNRMALIQVRREDIGPAAFIEFL